MTIASYWSGMLLTYSPKAGRRSKVGVVSFFVVRLQTSAVAMERIATDKRAGVLRIGMQFCAEDSIRAEGSQVDFRGGDHTEDRRSEVQPCAGPDVCENSRSRGSRRIDAEPRHGSEEENI